MTFAENQRFQSRFAFAVCGLLMMSLFERLPQANAQTQKLFEMQEIAVSGRLRQLTLKKVVHGKGMQVVSVERSGTYPDWNVDISVYGTSPTTRALKRLSHTRLPQDAVFYGFTNPTETNDSDLVVVRTKNVEVWRPGQNNFQPDPKLRRVLNLFPASQPGIVTAYNAVFESGGGDLIFVPGSDGIHLFKIEKQGLVEVSAPKFPSRLFYQSDFDNQALDLPFWVRATYWFPQLQLQKTRTGEVILSSWMDEVLSFPLKGAPSAPERIYLKQLSEDERDDGRSTVFTIPSDLNGDGNVDFVVNKFQGSITAMQCDSSIFLAKAGGTYSEKGLPIKAEGNRMGGALPIDLNNDGKMDLVVASTNYNTWAVIRALLRKQVHVTFSFYMQGPEGYHLDRANFAKEISFEFDLNDAEVKGLLPTLEGDFNGDGFPDALFARNRNELSIALQKPKEPEFFSPSSAITYQIPISHRIRVGDLDGDAKTDIVLFDRRAHKNQKFTVLMNSGQIK